MSTSFNIGNENMERQISRFVETARTILQEDLIGIYLHGSAVMGCFRQEKSDLDYIVVVRRDLTEAVKRTFMDSLVDLNQDGPAKGIEMSVVTADVCDPFQYPTPFVLHYSNMHTPWYRKDPDDYVRKMNGTDRDLAAHFTVIWSRGIALYGRPIPEVFGEIPEKDYLDSIWNDVSGAEEEIMEDPMYLILNLARIAAYLKEKKVMSKLEGGQWGLENLPSGFRDLIRAAINEYTGEGNGCYDAETAKQYAAYMLNRIMEERKKDEI